MLSPELAAAAREFLRQFKVAAGSGDIDFTVRAADNGIGREVIIAANIDGLLALAADSLKLALSEPQSGSHWHIDAASYANEGSTPLILEVP
ncbi:MAG: hypothetical protein JSR60_10340 [Proteobacteria bacterium]|nr:hypothetical protein [Pseudomonadota bacterium]